MDSSDSLNQLAVVFVLDSAGSCDTEALSDEMFRTDKLDFGESGCLVRGLSQHSGDTFLPTAEARHKRSGACRQVSTECSDPCSDQMNLNCNHNFEPGPFEGCGCTGSYNGGAAGGTNTCGCGETYQGGLVNKKTVCSDDSPYLEYPMAVQHNHGNNYSCCGCCDGPDTYELITNKDAQRYKGAGPDRSHYFAG